MSKVFENIIERIYKSGIEFKGSPIHIDIIRLRGIKDEPIDFYYEYR